MKTNLTEIIFCCDKSGSMQSIKSDMEGGLKTFLDQQRKEPGECRITYYEFDSEVKCNFSNVDIKDVKDLSINPGGSTALFDALGQSINEVGARLKNTAEMDRPHLVLFVAITDGENNASTKFTDEKIKEMIKHQEEKYAWKFIYLGANQDAFATGQSYGFGGATSISYAASSKGVAGSMDVLSRGISTMRANTNLVSSYSFSDDERKEAMGEKTI